MQVITTDSLLDLFHLGLVVYICLIVFIYPMVQVDDATPMYWFIVFLVKPPFASCAIYFHHDISYVCIFQFVSCKNIWHLNAYFILTVYVVYEYPTILKWYWFPLLSEHPKQLTAPPAIVPDHAAPAPAFFWWSKCLPLPLLRDLVALLGPEYDCRAPVYGS